MEFKKEVRNRCSSLAVTCQFVLVLQVSFCCLLAFAVDVSFLSCQLLLSRFLRLGFFFQFCVYSLGQLSLAGFVFIPQVNFHALFTCCLSSLLLSSFSSVDLCSFSRFPFTPQANFCSLFYLISMVHGLCVLVGVNP